MEFKSIEKITLDEFLNRMKLLLFKKVRERKLCWTKLIKSGKLVCPSTGKEVAYCSLDEQQNRAKSKHYNFYSNEGDLFTIDHIHPKSKGGSHTNLSNIQPMLEKENYKKGNKLNYKY